MSLVLWIAIIIVQVILITRNVVEQPRAHRAVLDALGDTDGVELGEARVVGDEIFEAERLEAERIAAEKAEADRLEAERLAAERARPGGLSTKLTSR